MVACAALGARGAELDDDQTERCTLRLFPVRRWAVVGWIVRPVAGWGAIAERRLGLFGVDYQVKEVRIGAQALAEDVLAHAEVIKLVERYNGLVGKLRKFWDGLRGKAGTTVGGVQYPHGSRGWVLANELEKIGKRIASTQLMRDTGQIDAPRAQAEIAFLTGAETYFREQLREVDPGAEALQSDLTFDLFRPDVGLTTKRAQAAGYKLPGELGAEVPGTRIDPAWYYYRDSVSEPGTFELARTPVAPAEAPQLRARVVGGRFVGIEVPAREPTLLLADLDAGKELEVLFAQDGTMAPYAQMLERAGLATRTVIEGAALRLHRKLAEQPRPSLDDWRHAVKDYFRERVVRKLIDPTLDASASYRQMRQIVDGLGVSDRGSLVEEWYRGRYAPNAQPRRQFEVTRTSGKNESKTETRVTDMIVGDEIREVKDIAGPIDKEQFGAYIDWLEEQSAAGAPLLRLRYVFTKPEGAIANLAFLARQYEARRLRTS